MDAPFRKYAAFSLWLVCGSLVLPAQTHRALLIGIDHYGPPAGVALPVPPAGHAPDSRFAPGTFWVNLQGPSVDVAGMQVLLKETFGFQDIRVLDEQQATRQGILAAIDRLIADTHEGDFDVLYYAGHGSQRLDTLSSKNQMDETIVPIDAWKGADDIRDKELALKFNKIVYDKHAHLTAIYDSCHSGTMARGITNSVQRTLPYDDRDVAAQKKADPSTVTEADLKQIPQRGDAIIIAAADSTESAVEALYPDDRQVHGAFTRALVRVLKSSTQSLSADDVVAEVSQMLHADPVPFQQPSVEGRSRQSLFGAPVAEHAMHVHVSKVSGDMVTLDMGSAAGFGIDTEFTAIEAGAGGEKAQLKVVRVEQPLAAVAQVAGGATVRVGQTFELSKMTYPQAARLVLFASKAEPAAAAIATARKLFPGLTWVDDPTATPIDFLVVDGESGWAAYGRNGAAVASGNTAKGAAFLLLGPSASVKAAMEQSVPFQRDAFSFTQNLTEANYLLAMRPRPGGSAEYALFDPLVLTPHKPGVWVTSPEDDPDDAKLNGGANPPVVCRNDVSLPVRTAWLPDGADSRELVLGLMRRIVRLGKLRVWMQSPSLAPGAGGWPYHLAATEPGSDVAIARTLRPDEAYDIRLLTTAEQRAASTTIPKYVYVFGFDCAANPELLYPPKDLNGVPKTPQPLRDGVYPLSVLIIQEAVGTPLGADTLFLLATAEAISTPSLLLSDGVLEAGSRGRVNGFNELVGDMNDAGSRGPKNVPTNWLVQQLVLPSRATDPAAARHQE